MYVAMDQSQKRVAWIAAYAVLGAAMFSSVAGRIASEHSVGLLIGTWIMGALAGSLFAWRVGEKAQTLHIPTKHDLRFTRDGWSALAWLSVFIVPPVGVVLGVWLRARGSAQGGPMILASTAAMAIYLTLAMAV